MHIQTVPQIKNNKPDITLWNKTKKTCHIIDVCVYRSTKTCRCKRRYTPLSISLHRLYPDYTYEIIPIVLGATGLITDSLVKSLITILEDKKTVHSVIATMQRKALIGSMRVLKSALSKKE